MVIALYEKYGEKFITKLRGMFAIALWDEANQKLLLIRDRFGKKPLHYYTDGQRLLFGSEIKSLLRDRSIESAIDYNSVEEFFSFGFISAPKTIYKNIKKIRPGHIMRFSNGSLEEHCYWKLTIQSPLVVSETIAKEIVENKLLEATRLRMISDVPLGAFLSGGIDSSLIVALMSQQSSKPIKTFSIGFENEKFNEIKFARLVAERFGTEHYEEIVRPSYKDLIDDLIANFDEPFGDSSALPTYVLSKMTRQHVTVALSGDGGDEIFGGYDLYYIALCEQKYHIIPSFLRPSIAFLSQHYPLSLRGGNTLFRMSIGSAQERYIERFKIMSDKERNLLYTKEFSKNINSYCVNEEKRKFFRFNSNLDFIRQLQFNDVHHYMPDDIFVKVDRMSMLNSLEVRSPLLDHQVIEFAFSLPDELLFKNGEKKYILKKILLKYFPREFVYRKKQGFAVPLKYWFRHGFLRVFNEKVFHGEIAKADILNMSVVKNIFESHIQKKADRSSLLWLILMFAIWYENHYLNKQ